MSVGQKKPQEEWVTSRIDAASKKFPVNAAVATEIKKQLNGKMREQTLPAGDLSKLAKSLLAAINDPPAESGAA